MIETLLLSLVGAASATFWIMRRNTTRLTETLAIVTTSRIGENDTGSATQYFPLLSVVYDVDGHRTQAYDLPLARASSADRSRISRLIETQYRAGATARIAFDPRRPERARLV